LARLRASRSASRRAIFGQPFDRVGIVHVDRAIGGVLNVGGPARHVVGLLRILPAVPHGGVRAFERPTVPAFGMVADEDRLSHRDPRH
jgi:hypothetical protein